MLNKNYMTKLFDFLVEAVLAEGRGGGAIVVSKYHKALASDFELYEQARANYFTKEVVDGIDGRSFINGQESITFQANKPLTNLFRNIIVEL